jgi:hypothetical protein
MHTNPLITEEGISNTEYQSVHNLLKLLLFYVSDNCLESIFIQRKTVLPNRATSYHARNLIWRSLDASRRWVTATTMLLEQTRSIAGVRQGTDCHYANQQDREKR